MHKKVNIGILIISFHVRYKAGKKENNYSNPKVKKNDAIDKSCSDTE